MKTNSEKVILSKLFGKKRVHTLHFNQTGPKYFQIRVHEGVVQVVHNSYSLDGNNWVDNPKRHSSYQSQYVIKAGEERIVKYEIGKVQKQHDKVFVINHHLFQLASFSIHEIAD
ncbi:hypothetical protein EsVE80_11620 [Enterococcus saigonensis]|uniref:Uncharacterized protein n=1 Tax=Enterococcus saigonensis TaxID=1805431 RepID=A0A679IBZ2_9ENTE|nr:hypothetical protein [Enterococcus saigonensis]BCA85639.1 hypothetical protein EsVE80_11620 [Enterococcus saigonensis]